MALDPSEVRKIAPPGPVWESTNRIFPLMPATCPISWPSSSSSMPPIPTTWRPWPIRWTQLSGCAPMRSPRPISATISSPLPRRWRPASTWFPKLSNRQADLGALSRRVRARTVRVKTCTPRPLPSWPPACVRGEFSSEELTRSFLDRIKRWTTPVQQLHHRYGGFRPWRRRAQPTSACAAGDAGPLTGIPFAHKDIFCTEGVKTSCGSRMLDNFIAPYDATVRRPAQAGRAR